MNNEASDTTVGEETKMKDLLKENLLRISCKDKGQKSSCFHHCYSEK